MNPTPAPTALSPELDRLAAELRAELDRRFSGEALAAAKVEILVDDEGAPPYPLADLAAVMRLAVGTVSVREASLRGSVLAIVEGTSAHVDAALEITIGAWIEETWARFAAIRRAREGRA